MHIIVRHCWKCKGSGVVKKGKKYVDCDECNGTGHEVVI